jgi:hypothetical protein
MARERAGVLAVAVALVASVSCHQVSGVRQLPQTVNHPSGAAPLIIDLDLVNPVLTRTVSAGTFQLRVRHRLPSQRYAIEVVEERIPLPPVDSLSHTGNVLFDVAGEDCTDSLLALAEELDAASEEPALDNVFRTWAVKNRSCVNEGRRLFDERTTLISEDVYTLHNGYRLRITIGRAGEPDSAIWKFTVTTQPRGEWQSLYGLTFVPDRDDHYFTEAGGEDKFFIREKKESSKGRFDLNAKFVPSVLISWVPTRLNSDWSFGPTAGLGYNFSQFAAFLGASASYNQNLAIIGGLTMHQQARLNGKYTKDQELSESLEEAQLVENSFRPNVFFGFALRLGKNPFASAEPTPPATGAQPAAQKPTEGETRNEGSDAGFDPSSVKKDDSIADLKVGSVTHRGDTVDVEFAGTLSKLTGKLTNATIRNQTQKCLKLDNDQVKRIPAPGDETADLVCFGTNSDLLNGLSNGDRITVDVTKLVVAVPTKDPSTSTYVATPTSAAKAPQ